MNSMVDLLQFIRNGATTLSAEDCGTDLQEFQRRVLVIREAEARRYITKPTFHYLDGDEGPVKFVSHLLLTDLGNNFLDK